MGKKKKSGSKTTGLFMDDSNLFCQNRHTKPLMKIFHEAQLPKSLDTESHCIAFSSASRSTTHKDLNVLELWLAHFSCIRIYERT